MSTQAEYGDLKRWHVVTNSARKVVWTKTAAQAKIKAEAKGLKVVRQSIQRCRASAVMVALLAVQSLRNIGAAAIAVCRFSHVSKLADTQPRCKPDCNHI